MKNLERTVYRSEGGAVLACPCPARHPITMAHLRGMRLDGVLPGELYDVIVRREAALAAAAAGTGQ